MMHTSLLCAGLPTPHAALTKGFLCHGDAETLGRPSGSVRRPATTEVRKIKVIIQTVTFGGIDIE
jgi:hypothetical protein